MCHSYSEEIAGGCTRAYACLDGRIDSAFGLLLYGPTANCLNHHCSIHCETTLSLLFTIVPIVAAMGTL